MVIHHVQLGTTYIISEAGVVMIVAFTTAYLL